MRTRGRQFVAMVSMNLRTNGVLYALMVSLCVNIAYSHRLRGLDPKGVEGPQPGDLVQPQRVRTSNRTTIDLVTSPRGVPTIIYYFSPTCGWCERNWSNVAALERQTRDRYRFVALAEAGEVQETILKHKLEFEVYGGLLVSDRRALKLSGTPQTIVISVEGRIVQAWAGAYSARLRDHIEEYFAVALPGLTTQAAENANARLTSESVRGTLLRPFADGRLDGRWHAFPL